MTITINNNNADSKTIIGIIRIKQIMVIITIITIIIIIIEKYNENNNISLVRTGS